MMYTILGLFLNGVMVALPLSEPTTQLECEKLALELFKEVKHELKVLQCVKTNPPL